KTAGPHLGQRSRPYAAGPRAREKHGSGPATSGWIGSSRREVAPTVLETGGWQVDVIAQTQVQDQMGIDTPVILNVAAEIVKLLADKSDGVDLASVGITQQERGESISALSRICDAGLAGLQIAEAYAAGDALAPEAIVVVQLVHAAELQGVRTLNPSEVVVVG